MDVYRLRVAFSKHSYSKTCVKRPLSKRPKTGFQDQILLIVWMILQHFWPSLSFHLSLRSLFLSMFEWPFYTGFTLPGV